MAGNLTLDGGIHYYEMSGQMKVLLDRLNPLYKADYKFRDIYMIATAAENEESAFEKAYNGLQGWVDCFEKAALKGIVTGMGIGDANDAVNHTDVMKKAYALGNRLE
ncbi:MAG: flavodoxin family protein [Eubacteriales bacterium]|nr:flavodoxin family protein [Eubacteriales bacterium]